MHLSFFSLDLTVITAKKKRPILLIWPIKMQEWEDLLGSIYSKYELNKVVRQKMRNQELKMAKRVTRYKPAIKMHYKYDIIAYLYQYNTFLTFSYINISKLSCKLCYNWIKAFNKTMSIRFYIKDCHKN